MAVREVVSVEFRASGGRQLIAEERAIAVGADRANVSLQRLSRVRITPTGGRVLERELGGIGRTAAGAAVRVSAFRAEARSIVAPITGATRALASFQGSLGAIGGALLIRQLIQTADQFTDLQNRLRTVTEDERELAQVQQQLFQTSQDTRSGFAGTVEIFTRSALAARELGLSQQELIGFTKSLNQAVILSGASAEEANAALIQLSQGIASGTLRGDELRSVLEQLPVVADVIARSLGVTRGQLRELGAEGKISAQQVIQAFAEARTELDERFGKSVPTISQSFGKLTDSLGLAINRLDQATGASAALGGALVGVADALNSLDKDALKLISATLINVPVAAASLDQIGNLVRLIRSLRGAPAGAITDELQRRLAASRRDFTDAQLDEVSPFLAGDSLLPARRRPEVREALPSPLAGGSGRRLGTDLGEFDPGEFRKIQDAANPAAAAVRQFEEDVRQLRIALATPIEKGGIDQAEFDRIFAGLARQTRDAREPFEALRRDTQEQIRLLGLSTDAREREAEVIAQVRSLERQGEDVGPRRIAELRAMALALQEATRETQIRDEAIRAALGPEEDLSRARRVLTDVVRQGSLSDAQAALTLSQFEESAARTRQAVIDLRDPVARLRDDFEALSRIPLTLSADEFDVERDLAGDRLDRQRSGQRPLTLVEEDETRQLLRFRQVLSDTRRVIEDVRGPGEDFRRTAEGLGLALGTGAISAEEFQQRLRSARIELLETDRTISGGLERGLLRLREEFGDVGRAVEDTFVNAVRNARDVLTDFLVTGEGDIAGFLESLQRDIVRQSLDGLIDKGLGQVESALPGLLDVFGLEAPGGQRARNAGVAGPTNPAGIPGVGEAAGIAGEIAGGEAGGAAALAAAGTTLTGAGTALTGSATALTTASTTSATAISTAASTSATAIGSAAGASSASLSAASGALLGAAGALSSAAAALTAAAGAQGGGGGGGGFSADSIFSSVVGSAGSGSNNTALEGLGDFDTGGTVFAARGFRGIVRGRPGTDANRVTIAATSGEEITVRTPAQQRMGPVPGFRDGGQVLRRNGVDEIFAASNARAVRARGLELDREPAPRGRRGARAGTTMNDNRRFTTNVTLVTDSSDTFGFTERQLNRRLRRAT